MTIDFKNINIRIQYLVYYLLALIPTFTLHGMDLINLLKYSRPNQGRGGQQGIIRI
jgi:hypothetical protein